MLAFVNKKKKIREKSSNRHRLNEKKNIDGIFIPTMEMHFFQASLNIKLPI